MIFAHIFASEWPEIPFGAVVGSPPPKGTPFAGATSKTSWALFNVPIIFVRWVARGTAPEFYVEFDFAIENFSKNPQTRGIKNLGFREIQNPYPYIVYALYNKNILNRQLKTHLKV